MPKANIPSDVFHHIDTHGNDPSVCWEWQGSLGGRDGRGYIQISGKKLLAHRVVFELMHGPIEPNLVVRHTCDNPVCCNPVHLVIGTRGQNEKDKYDRDRMGYTNDMLREMRRCAKLGMTYQAIADRVNKMFKTQIVASGVGKVIRGERRA